jgi:beta-lactam-binding protein with PASTA domain
VTVLLPSPTAKPTYVREGSRGTSEAPGVRAQEVIVSLRLPDADAGGDGDVRATLAAGGQAAVVVLVRNQSSIVDNYDIEVTGIAREWWLATPPTVYLVPFGSRGGSSEQEIELRFQPPRTEEAEARSWPITVIARSRADPAKLGSAEAALEISPFAQLESQLRATRSTGRRSGCYAIMVVNHANAPVVVVPSATDADGVCTFTFSQPQFAADPGRRAGTKFTVRPNKPIWIGRTVDRRFEVAAHALDADAAAPPQHAVFHQRAWLPWWLAVVAPIAILAGVLALTLIPKQTTVPNLVGVRPAQADVLLGKAGLKLSPSPPIEQAAHAPGGTIVQVVPAVGSHVKSGSTIEIQIAEPAVPKLIGQTQAQAALTLQNAGLALSPAAPQKKVSKGRVGAIVAQTPGAGRRVKTGSQVSIVVAVGTGTRKVPSVVGLTLADAEKKLRASGLSIVLPQLPPGVDAGKAKVSTQIPSPGEVVKANEPVSVFVPPPVKPKPTTLPAIAGETAAGAAAALTKLGAVVTESRRFDPRPTGAVIGQVPPKGSTLKPGQKVVLVVSAGYPELAYSDGNNIVLIRGSDGSTVKSLAATPDTEDEPSWQPNGTLVAYRRGPSGNPDAGRIWVVDATKAPVGARPITPGPDDRRPAFSPDGRVLAYIHSSGGTNNDLCFVRVAAPGTPSCIRDASISVDRPTWAPDGRAILTVATDPTDANQTELLEYASTQPFSARQSDWVSQGLVSNAWHGKRRGEGVLFAAWSPDGKSVAIVANWGAANLSFFHVFMSAASADVLGRPVSVVPQIRACEVAWRSDGGELAAVQADDCRAGLGTIVRVDPKDPGSQTPLRQLAAKNPAWQSIALNGR